MPPRLSIQPMADAVILEEPSQDASLEQSVAVGVTDVPGGHADTPRKSLANVAITPADLTKALSSSVLGLPPWAENLPAPPPVPVACRTVLSPRVHTELNLKYDKWRETLTVGSRLH